MNRTRWRLVNVGVIVWLVWHIKCSPPNPLSTNMRGYTLIDFSNTDGISSRWPACRTLPDGAALERLFPDDDRTVQFLGKLAIQLANLLNYPGAYPIAFHLTERTNCGQTDGAKFKITGLPGGYRLFVRSARNGRRDTYLRGAFDSRSLSTRPPPNTPPGSCHVNRFRSPAEFAPHALWLLIDASLDPSNCRCKYCRQRSNPHGPQTDQFGPVKV